MTSVLLKSESSVAPLDAAMAELKEQGACPWNILCAGADARASGDTAWRLWKTSVLPVACFTDPAVQERRPFDCITLCEEAEKLIAIAPDVKAVLDENGYVILSGFAPGRAKDILKAYEGLAVRRKNPSILILQDTAS